MPMKRFVIFILVAMTGLSVFAQYQKGQHLYSTVNRLNIRTGPGKKYPVFRFTENNTGIVKKFQLKKRQGLNIGMGVDGFFYITYLGESKNGFLHVTTGSWWFNNMVEEDMTMLDGWVAARYLRPVCKKCDGYGFTEYMGETKCPQCHGRGY